MVSTSPTGETDSTEVTHRMLYKIDPYKEADQHSAKPDPHEDILHSTNETPLQPREIPLIN